MPINFFFVSSRVICSIASDIKFTCLLQSNGNGNGTSSSGNGDAANGNSSGVNGGSTLRVTEQQVARLMEEDMGSAMQYLQGKGLCLIPISLASALSSATSSSLLPRTSIRPMGGAGHQGGCPASPPLASGVGDDDSRTIKDTGARGEQ